MTVVDSPAPGRWRPRTVALRLRADDRLAGQAARGDTEAFGVLYERHHRSLYRYCRSIVGDPDDAADALQGAMTRALAAIGRRDEHAPVRAWLFRIAHNESVSVVRRRRGTEPLNPESLIGPDVEADADGRRRLTQLVSDLQALSERQRGALLMRELSGLGHAEIATALQTSEGAVKQAIFEARTALYDFEAGREMACTAVRRRLSDGDGRTARTRSLHAHLRACGACRQFRAELQAGRAELAAVAPVLPSATAAAVLESVIGSGAAGGAAAGGAAAGGAAAGGAAAGGLPVALEISKAIAVGAATVTAGASAVTFTAVVPEGRSVTPAASAADAAPRHRSDSRPAADAPAAGDAGAPAAAGGRPPRDVGPQRRSQEQASLIGDEGGEPDREGEVDRGRQQVDRGQRQVERGYPGPARAVQQDSVSSGEGSQDPNVPGSPKAVPENATPVPAGEDDSGSSVPAPAPEVVESDPVSPAPEPETAAPNDGSAPAPEPMLEPEAPPDDVTGGEEPAVSVPEAETPTPDAPVESEDG